ncbi:hypothetical protein PVAP13_3KG203308 [Panicum virgatum]|uniref:Uncharacterized protein n=1 Tax=Panicum virgatum TaxID=38727 RepID=A0A8T0UX13_PANVG|nr:hypothetical protein PVAP13_3KG203308 [Panicum virgatum]
MIDAMHWARSGMASAPSSCAPTTQGKQLQKAAFATMTTFFNQIQDLAAKRNHVLWPSPGNDRGRTRVGLYRTRLVGPLLTVFKYFLLKEFYFVLE